MDFDKWRQTLQSAEIPYKIDINTCRKLREEKIDQSNQNQSISLEQFELCIGIFQNLKEV